MSEEKQIADGQRIEEFLTDEQVKGALVKLEKKYVDEWMKGGDVSAREAAHAKTRVLQDFVLELRAIVGQGQRAQIEKSRREKFSQPSPPRRYGA